MPIPTASIPTVLGLPSFQERNLQMLPLLRELQEPPQDGASRVHQSLAEDNVRTVPREIPLELIVANFR